jgi:predicted DNA-binding protein
MSYNKRQSTTVLSLRIPVDLLKRINSMAMLQGRTTANMIRLLLKEAASGNPTKSLR